jgi:hypothetical protein
MTYVVLILSKKLFWMNDKRLIGIFVMSDLVRYVIISETQNICRRKVVENLVVLDNDWVIIQQSQATLGSVSKRARKLKVSRVFDANIFITRWQYNCF